MSFFDYEKSKEVANTPFYGLIMAAMRKADTDNLEKLKAAFPEQWQEFKQRYNAPAGCLNYDEFQRWINDSGVTESMFNQMAGK